MNIPGDEYLIQQKVKELEKLHEIMRKQNEKMVTYYMLGFIMLVLLLKQLFRE